MNERNKLEKILISLLKAKTTGQEITSDVLEDLAEMLIKNNVHKTNPNS